jgi:hypothetical protein
MGGLGVVLVGSGRCKIPTVGVKACGHPCAWGLKLAVTLAHPYFPSHGLSFSPYLLPIA